MRVSDYFRLLRENRFQVHPFKYPMTLLGTGCAVVNSTLAGVQYLTHGKNIRNATLDQPPVFIIGHWRSGTTLMHELMAMDSRMAFPTNFDAFVLARHKRMILPCARLGRLRLIDESLFQIERIVII